MTSPSLNTFNQQLDHGAQERIEIQSAAKTRLPWRYRIALFLFGCLWAAVMVEAGYRIFTRDHHTAAPRTDRPRHYYFPANATTDRDYAYPLAKPADTWRIVVLGDSFTYGVGLQFNDTFAKRLEALFSLRGAPPRVEVLNLGVPGYSSAQEVTAARVAMKYQPDLLLVELTLNDPEKKPYRAAHAADETGGIGLRLFDYWKSLGFMAARIRNSWSHVTFKQYYRDLFENPDTWNNFTRSYDNLNALSERFQVPLAVLIFPLFSHELDAGYPFLDIHKKIRAMLNEKQIKHLDLLGSFRGIPSNRLQLIPNVDSHPNEIAHRIAAEAIYEWFRAKKIVPAEFTTVPRSDHRHGDPRTLDRSLGIR